MAEDNKPQGNEGGDNGQQTEPAKEVVSYAKHKRETDEYQEQVKALKAELEQRDKQIEEFTAKAGNADELQAALDKAKADNEAYKADAEKREAEMRRDFAIDTKLAQMGVRNAKAARAIIPEHRRREAGREGQPHGHRLRGPEEGQRLHVQRPTPRERGRRPQGRSRHRRPGRLPRSFRIDRRI